MAHRARVANRAGKSSHYSGTKYKKLDLPLKPPLYRLNAVGRGRDQATNPNRRISNPNLPAMVSRIYTLSINKTE